MKDARYAPLPIRGVIAAGVPTKGEEVLSGCIAVDLSTIGISPNARTFALRVEEPTDLETELYSTIRVLVKKAWEEGDAESFACPECGIFDYCCV